MKKYIRYVLWPIVMLNLFTLENMALGNYHMQTNDQVFGLLFITFVFGAVLFLTYVPDFIRNF